MRLEWRNEIRKTEWGILLKSEVGLILQSCHYLVSFLHFSHDHSNHSNLIPFRCYFLIHCLFVSWNEPGMIGNDLISCSVSNHSRPGMRQEWFNILNIWCCLFIIWSITDPAARAPIFSKEQCCKFISIHYNRKAGPSAQCDSVFIWQNRTRQYFSMNFHARTYFCNFQW